LYIIKNLFVLGKDDDFSTSKNFLERFDQLINEKTKVCSQNFPVSPRKGKILVIAGNGIGQNVISSVFSNPNGVFIHSDPLDELLLNDHSESESNIAKLIHRLEVLSKCKLLPNTFDIFKSYQRKTVASNEYLRYVCTKQQEDICETSQKILMETCSR